MNKHSREPENEEAKAETISIEDGYDSAGKSSINDYGAATLLVLLATQVDKVETSVLYGFVFTVLAINAFLNFRGLTHVTELVEDAEDRQWNSSYMLAARSAVILKAASLLIAFEALLYFDISHLKF